MFCLNLPYIYVQQGIYGDMNCKHVIGKQDNTFCLVDSLLLSVRIWEPASIYSTPEAEEFEFWQSFPIYAFFLKRVLITGYRFLLQKMPVWFFCFQSSSISPERKEEEEKRIPEQSKAAQKKGSKKTVRKTAKKRQQKKRQKVEEGELFTCTKWWSECELTLVRVREFVCRWHLWLSRWIVPFWLTITSALRSLLGRSRQPFEI